ncbi:MAG: hypothetical protein JJ992_27550, partial [Planctomycetes bacterium]|nr:hypothetical protein [Planctomycetota bacterium]
QPALSLRQVTTVPVVYVPPDDSTGESSAKPEGLHRLDREHSTPAPAGTLRLHHFAIGRLRLAVSENHREDESRIVSQWQPHADDFDLAEPFGRIREAIEEARRTAR